MEDVPFKERLYHLRHGEWSAGCEFWEGKPMLLLCHIYFCGWHYVLHIGPLWIECDYPPMIGYD